MSTHDKLDESNMLWATVRLAAEVSDWKRDSETLVQWAERTLKSARSAVLPPEETCWMIERGQADRQVPTIWFTGDALHNTWTEKATEAKRFTSKEQAEQEADHLFARYEGDPRRMCTVTEHVFLDAPASSDLSTIQGSTEARKEPPRSSVSNGGGARPNAGAADTGKKPEVAMAENVGAGGSPAEVIEGLMTVIQRRGCKIQHGDVLALERAVAIINAARSAIRPSVDGKELDELYQWVERLCSRLRAWDEYHRNDSDIEGDSKKASLWRDARASALGEDGAKWTYFAKLNRLEMVLNCCRTDSSHRLMADRNSLRVGKHFWTGRMFSPLEAVVALTWTIHADRAGVWGSPLRSNLTPLAQYPVSLHPTSTRAK